MRKVKYTFRCKKEQIDSRDEIGGGGEVKRWDVRRLCIDPHAFAVAAASRSRLGAAPPRDLASLEIASPEITGRV